MPATKSLAYAMRALALSLDGALEQALPDYDNAIKLDPMSSMALNNRAWVNYKLDRLNRRHGRRRALPQAPRPPAHTLTTRAPTSTRRSANAPAALRDYEQATRYGGEHLVKLYQCGLEAQRRLQRTDRRLLHAATSAARSKSA